MVKVCGTICQIRVVESQVRVIERAEKRSTPQGQQIQRMNSKGMYFGLQGTRILVGVLRVATASSAESVHASDWNNDISANEGLAGRRWQIECTRLQVWVRARAIISVFVPTRRAYDPQCSIGDFSRALDISRHAAQQKSTTLKCEAAVAI